jgi:hypothetical protein
MDIIFGIKTFLSTWPIPEQTPFVWGAIGTFSTCTAFGFIGHGASLASAIYNGSLTVYFLLTIAFSWREQKIRDSYVEFFLHAIPLTIGWGTAVVGIPLDLYNPIGWTCWIGTFPPGCGVAYPCLRGDFERQDAYRWAFFHAYLWVVFLFSALAMLLIYRSVRKREDAMHQYDFEDHSSSFRVSEKRESLSRKVAIQSFLFVFFFFLTWIFPMVQFVVAQETGYLYFPLLCLTVIFTPLQGFFDVSIYLRPRYLKYRVRRRSSGGMVTRRQAVIMAFSAANDHDNKVEGETYDPEEDPVLQQDRVARSSPDDTTAST